MNKHASSSKINILLLKTQRDKPFGRISLGMLKHSLTSSLIFAIVKGVYLAAWKGLALN